MPGVWTRGFRAPLFAFVVVIEDRALPANDFAAMIAVGLEAVLTDQRTDPRRLQLDRIQRIDACNFDVEFRFGTPIEQRHRTLRRRVPFAIGISAETADAAQLGLHRSCELRSLHWFSKLSRRRTGAQRGNVRSFLGFLSLGLLGRRRAGRGPVRGRATSRSYDLGTLVGG